MVTTVNFTCLCGQSNGTAEVAAQSLPVETDFCHCNICRYTSGVLCVSYLKLASPPQLKATVATYQSSEKLERKFCSLCGSHIFAYIVGLDEWSLANGLIEACDPSSAGRLVETMKLVHHEFVSDTVDGGLTPCLANFQGRSAAIFAQGPDEEPLKVNSDGHADLTRALQSMSHEQRWNPSSSSSEDSLYASCHCGGVQFMISRPNEESRQLSSPWPDLLRPYHTAKPENEDDVRWWLHSDGRKYIAGTCACRSCRLASGFPIQTWAFVPRFNIVSLEGQPISFNIGTMQHYESSPGVYREFCSKCGATVFWHCDDRANLIDVSVGLLRAKEGCRADSWLEWVTKRVSFKEDAIDKELIDALEAGLLNIAQH